MQSTLATLRFLFVLLLVPCAAVAAKDVAPKDHSLSITNVLVTTTQATFTGTSTAMTSLNLEMEARVCNAANTTTFIGNRHTFTAVGETFEFTVNLSGFAVNDQVIVSITDILATTDCNDGGEGAVVAGTVEVPAATPVPVMDRLGLGLLILGFLGFAAWGVRRFA